MWLEEISSIIQTINLFNLNPGSQSSIEYLGGANVRIRTVDLLITSELLCHLSYIGYGILYFAVRKIMCIFARIRYYASWKYSSTHPMENKK